VTRWMHPTPGRLTDMNVMDMACISDVEVENVKTRDVTTMGTLWADQPVVVCFLRKLG